MKNHYKLLFSLTFLMLVCGLKATTVINIQDSISTNTHWTNDKQYLLHGYVYVTSGATLTIDAGTIVKGDKATKGALIIERGAKLMAMGTANAPVVFTSNEAAGNRGAGDWGGVILCGNARNNTITGTAQVEGGPRSFYGGSDDHDNSGELHYVRIEFGGIAFSPNNEVNGLTFCSVGDATQVDHIQISYSGDDAIEWFGGNVNSKYLVTLGTLDDDFDTDFGFSGNNQYGLVLRDPDVADISGSKAFESDSYSGATVAGRATHDSTTHPVFSNFTVIGPLVHPTDTGYNSNFVAAAHIRRGSSISIMNSIIVGFPAGVLVDESSKGYGSTVANIAADRAQFMNNAVAGMANGKNVFYTFNGARSLTPTTTWGDTTLLQDSTAGNSWAPYAGPKTWFAAAANANSVFTDEQNGIKLNDPFNLTAPNFVPTSASPVVSNAAHAFNPANPINTDTSNNYANYNAPTLVPSYASAKLQGSFFEHANHIGAFGTDGATWTQGWTNFDPNNADYTTNAVVNGIADNTANTLYLKVSPNPAHEAASISYSVAISGKVNIELYNVTGQLVKTVYSGNAEPGNYNMNFSTADMNTGLYFINVTTSNGKEAIRLSVVK